MLEEQDFQKPAARELKISDISQEHKRVALIGEIVSLQPKALKAVFSDGSDKIELVFSDERHLSSCGKGFLRVIGRPFFNDDGIGINVECVHSLQNLNLGLWEKITALEKEFFGGVE